jgi:hypothetical protein
MIPSHSIVEAEALCPALVQQARKLVEAAEHSLDAEVAQTLLERAARIWADLTGFQRVVL